MIFSRPEGFTRHEALRAALASTAVQLKIPAGLAMIVRVCAPLFATTAPPHNWFPDITPEHARATIKYARRMLDGKAITAAEYDFICDKARRVLFRPLPDCQTELPDAEGKKRFAASLESFA